MSADDDDGLLEAFSLIDEADVDEASDPRPIAAKLVAECEQFAHLKEGDAAILFLFRNEEQIKQQRQILGTMMMPTFSGTAGAIGSWLLERMCGTMPDFIMTLDREFWRNASVKSREALIFHELLHAAHALDKEGEPRFTPEGDPVWGIRGHDVEEFDDVVRRYGAWKQDLVSFKRALNEGDGA